MSLSCSIPGCGFKLLTPADLDIHMEARHKAKPVEIIGFNAPAKSTLAKTLLDLAPALARLQETGVTRLKLDGLEVELSAPPGPEPIDPKVFTAQEMNEKCGCGHIVAAHDPGTGLCYSACDAAKCASGKQ